MSPVRNRYHVDLAALQATCEANYARLMRLVPQMRSAESSRQVALQAEGKFLGALVLQVLENNPYTSTLRLQQDQTFEWLAQPYMEVRVYHDARMAEVIAAQNARNFRGVYSYPNPDMYQPDEKAQLNLFLGEWLSHCLACGHEPLPVI